MKNELFVTAGEVAQELGVFKPFAYKLVRQMNEELEKRVCLRGIYEFKNNNDISEI